MEVRNDKYSLIMKHYEVLYKNIEYLDSTIYKIVGLYVILAGAFVANLHSYSGSKTMLAVYVIIAGFIFFAMLKRTASLIDAQVSVIKVYQAILSSFESSISETFPSNYGKGMRISTIGMIGISIMTVSAVITITQILV